jgi:hypothetical protein
MDVDVIMLYIVDGKGKEHNIVKSWLKFPMNVSIKLVDDVHTNQLLYKVFPMTVSIKLVDDVHTNQLLNKS